MKSIRIIPSREIACDLCWDGWETGQGKSWELSSMRLISVKNLFRVTNVRCSINHHGTAAEDLNGNWLVFVLRGGYYKWHGNCRSDCLIDWHSSAKTCNFSLVLTFALMIVYLAVHKNVLCCFVTLPSSLFWHPDLTRTQACWWWCGDQSEAVIVISEWQIADYNTSSDQNIYRHKAPHSRLSDPILSWPGAMFDPCPDILMLCCDNLPGRTNMTFCDIQRDRTKWDNWALNRSKKSARDR